MEQTTRLQEGATAVNDTAAAVKETIGEAGEFVTCETGDKENHDGLITQPVSAGTQIMPGSEIQKHPTENAAAKDAAAEKGAAENATMEKAAAEKAAAEKAVAEKAAGVDDLSVIYGFDFPPLLDFVVFSGKLVNI
uniref:Uncharacterized protein n=1 Tax=Octactis speculum TaxID=3111310 RepID=A0A7S2BRF6_9STRA|mmetsp:Transcript_26129/g.35960  ORF Transcript_26129/g.35960 Transcript_26129/m.35960 type:complete len:136 (+) Transcript_26129:658-1065(+)